MTCNLCGSRAQETFLLARDTMFHTGDYCLVCCSKCGLIFLNPRPSRNFLFRHNEMVYRVPRGKAERVFYDLIEKFKQFKDTPFRINNPVNGKRLLEVGCSSGYLLKIMEKRGWDVYGVDINPSACDYARYVLGLKNIFCRELHEVGWKNDYFDVVTIHHVLEHAGDPFSMIKEAHRILKADGKLFIEVPNIASFEFRIFRENWGYLSAPRHLYHFTSRTLTKMLRKAGFIIDSIHYPILIPHLFAVSLLNVFKNKFPNKLKQGKSIVFLEGLLFPAFLPLCIIVSMMGKGSSMLVRSTKM